jgi:hypothetical protein
MNGLARIPQVEDSVEDRLMTAEALSESPRPGGPALRRDGQGSDQVNVTPPGVVSLDCAPGSVPARRDRVSVFTVS